MSAALSILRLERNNAGHLFISVTDLNETGDLAVRSAVLSSSNGTVHDDVMARRFDDMTRLMAGNVTAESVLDKDSDLWLDHRNIDVVL